MKTKSKNLVPADDEWTEVGLFWRQEPEGGTAGRGGGGGGRMSEEPENMKYLSVKTIEQRI